MTDAARYWAQWSTYTKPFCAALTAAFGVTWVIENTGGGCICIIPTQDLEGGLTVYIGSGVDGPLLTNEERETYRAEHGRYDGFGLSVVDWPNADGGTASSACDLLAETPEQLVELVKRALLLARDATPTQQRTWDKAEDGTITESWSAR